MNKKIQKLLLCFLVLCCTNYKSTYSSKFKKTKKIEKIKGIKSKRKKVTNLDQKKKTYQILSIKEENITPEILETAKEAEKTNYSIDDIITIANHQAYKISDTSFNENEIMLQNQLGVNTINAIKEIIFWETNNLAFNTNPLLITDQSNNNENKTIIENNTNIIKKQIKNNTKLTTISKNSNLLLLMIAKICSDCIKKNKSEKSLLSQIKNFFKVNHNNYCRNLNKSAKKYNAIANYIFTNNPNINFELKKITPAHIILFGITTFEHELKKILENFSSSEFFNNIIKIFSTSINSLQSDIPEINTITNLIGKYQKATKKTFDKICQKLDIKIDYSLIKIIPELKPTPWYLSKTFILLLTSLAGTIPAGIVAYTNLRKKDFLTNNIPKNNSEDTLKNPIAMENIIIPTIATATASKYAYNKYKNRNTPESGTQYYKQTELLAVPQQEEDTNITNEENEDEKYEKLISSNQALYNELTEEQKRDLDNFISLRGSLGIPKSLYSINLSLLEAAFRLVKFIK